MAQDSKLQKLNEYYKDIEKVTPDIIRTVVERSITEAKRYIDRKYNGKIPSYDELISDYYYAFPKSDEFAVSISDFYLANSLKDIIRDPEILLRIYERKSDLRKVMKAEDKNYRYTADKLHNYELIAHDLFFNVLNSRDQERISKLQMMQGEQRKKLSEELVRGIKHIYKVQMDELVKKYSLSIKRSITILDELGVLSLQLKKNNDDRNKIGLRFLTFEKSSLVGDRNYCLDNLKDENFLSKIPFEKLVLLHAFYANRLKKVADNLSIGIYLYIQNSDLSKKIDEIDIDKAIISYKKYKILERIFNEGRYEIFSKLELFVAEEINHKGGAHYIKLDANKIYSAIIVPYEKQYNIFFGDDANLREDYNIYYPLAVEDYITKDFSLEIMLTLAFENLKRDNWGYILEEHNGKNSIKRKKDNVLLGFDLEGFNMPVRLHFPLKRLQAFLMMYNKNYDIPKYVGAEDMAIWDKNIGASVLMPLSPAHRKFLISSVKKMSNVNPYYNLARHIECMQYPNNLDRLIKWKDPNGRRGVRRYINIQTGDEIESLKSR